MASPLDPQSSSPASFPPGAGHVPLDGEGALDALMAMADDADPMEILGGLLGADGEPAVGTRPGVAVPGEANSLEISLTAEQEQRLADELCELIDDYKLAMAERRETEAEIRDAYAQKFDPIRGGSQPDSAALASEMMTSFVDQAAARLTTNFMSAQPAVTVSVTRGAGIEGAEADQLAGDTEHFINSYAMEEMDFRHLLPVALLRSAKVGTAVFYLGWEEETRVHFEYSPNHSKPIRKERKVGRVAPKLLDNDNVFLWPPTTINWQRGYDFVGHEESLTPGQWRAIAGKYGLDADTIETIENFGPEVDEAAVKEAERQGINSRQIQDHDALKPTSICELWCNMPLPGRDERERFQVILHKEKRKILWIGYNGYHAQDHPYFPVRYKWGDNSGWGAGIGHEILNNYAADTALWCLELDNLYAGAYWAILRRNGSMYDTQSDMPRPGMVIPVDDVEKDFKPIKLGGGVPEVGATRTANQSRAASGSGLSSVMFGQGDPVQKSGTGTGATNALIEQGNKKLAAIDFNMRSDISQIYQRALTLIAQFAQEGIFYRRVDETAATNLQRLLYMPPRGDVSQMFQFKAQAPSVNSTDEARKNGYMMIWTFATEQSKLVDQFVTEVLQTANPAAIPRWKQSIIEYLNAIAKKVIEFTEMPGVSDYIPAMPEMTPEDQQINQLNQQAQQLQAQLAQAQQQLQQLAQQGLGMAAPGGQPPADPAQAGMPPGAPGQPGMDPSQGAGGMPPGMGMPPPPMPGMEGGADGPFVS